QEVVVAAWGRESVARASEENLTQVPYRVCGSLKFGCSGAPGTLPGLLCRTVETQETPQDEKTGSESLGPRFLQDTFLQASQIAPEQIAGPRRFADASAMRLDLEPVLLHPAVADASSMHRRCGAILRPHLLRPHSGSQKVTISGRPCMRFWGARRYRIKRRRTCRRGLPGGGEPSEPTIGIVEPIVSQLPKPEKEAHRQFVPNIHRLGVVPWDLEGHSRNGGHGYLPAPAGREVCAHSHRSPQIQGRTPAVVGVDIFLVGGAGDAHADLAPALGPRVLLVAADPHRGVARRCPWPVCPQARGVAAGGPERGQQGAPERGGPEPAARPARPRSLTVARRAASWRPFGDPRSRVAGRRSPRARGRGERRGGRGGKGGARGRGPGH
ncbi:unnamed protein product, partial [Prorocentrum cordatum]